MNEIIEQVQRGDFDPIKLFTDYRTEIFKVKTAVKDFTTNLPKELCVNLFVTKIVPAVFDENVDNSLRDELIEVGFHFLQFINVTKLDTKEQDKVFSEIEETYTKVVGELRDSDYPNWDKLWIFLIKLCSEKLHSRLSTTNRLLRLVEVAFRNSSTEQRLKAYDCWIELINNSSLNMEYLCGGKQIKLLVTPMKAKFARTPTVIVKRCDTFIYLLEKLQDKATLCLKEFLEFCFEPFDEKNDSEKTRQGRSVPEVCCKGTKVLLEILGHSHDPLVKCLKSDEFQLVKPLVTNDNFHNFAEILINSVMECCTLLHNCKQEKSIIGVIIQCLWKSLLRLIHQSSDDVKEKCCRQINNLLRKSLESTAQNDFLYLVLGNVVVLLVRDRLIDEFRDMLFAVAIHLLWMINFQTCTFLEIYILKFVHSCLNAENSSKFHNMVSNYFKSDTECANPNHLSSIWCKILVSFEDFRCLIWPVRYLHEFKDATSVKSKWVKLFECKPENVKIIFLQKLAKLFLDNQTLGSNIVEFLELISSAETNPTKDFVAKLMKLVELILNLPDLSKSDVKKLSSTILFYCHQNLYFYKCEGNDEAINKLCSCLENIITIHKEYSVLDELATHLKNSQTKILVKFSKRLIPFFETLMLNDDNTIVNSARQLIELLEIKENERDPFMKCTRSLRIINMANVTPKAKKLGNQSNVFKTLPLTSKSKVSPLRGKKKGPILSINEDSSSDYVKIDTKVKLDLDNLNEHQKEMLSRRRDDIPALYEDLTRSQSQDFFKIKEAESPSMKDKRSDDETETQTLDILKEMKEETSLNSFASELSSLFDREKKIESNETEPKASPKTVKKVTKIRRVAKPKKLRHKLYNAVKKQLEKSETTKVNQNGIQSNEDNSEVVDEIIQNTEETSIRKSKRQIKTRKLDFFQTTSMHIKREKRSLDDLLALVDKRVENSRKNEEGKTDAQDDNQNKIPIITIQKLVRSSRTRKNPKPMNKPTFKIKLQKKKTLFAKKQQIKTEIPKDKSDDVYEFKTEEDAPSAKPKKPVKRVKKGLCLDQSDYIKKRKKIIKKEISHITAETTASSSPVVNSQNPVPTSSCSTPVSTSNSSLPTPVLNYSSVVTDRCSPPDLTDKNLVSTSSSPTPVSPVRTSRCRTPVLNSKSSVPSKRCPTPVVTDKNVVSTSSSPTPVSPVRTSRCRTPVLNSKCPVTTNRSPTPILTDKSSVPTPVSASKSSVRKRRCPTSVLTKKSSVPTISSSTSKSSVSTTRSPTPIPTDKSLVPTSNNPTPVSTNQSSVLINTCLTPNSTNVNPGPTSSSPPSLIPLTCKSPTPTSKSPSPESKNKTLTVVITPLNQSKESNESIEIGETSDSTPLPSRRSRRKQSFENIRSLEDVIESSQASQNNHSTRLQSRYRLNRNLKQQTIDEVLTTPSKPKSHSEQTNKNKNNQSLCESTPKNVKPIVLRKRSKSLDNVDEMITKVTFTEEVKINDTSADTLTLESVKADEKTPPEQEQIQQADTLTLSPVKSQTTDDLPGSPVTCDTPDRTNEFLNSTSDISPISIEQEEAPSTPKPSQVPNMRSARLLRMANSNVQVPNSNRRWFGNKHSSPSVSRVCKMKMRKEETLDILTFSREVPSPLTVPASGILKRKNENVDEVAPAPKRKRVNFSDPAITEKKIFIRESEEFEDDQNDKDNTDNVDEELEKKPEASALDREGLRFSFTDFWDSNFEDTSKGKQALQLLIQKLKVPDIVEVISPDEINDQLLITNLLDKARNNKIANQELIEKQIHDQVAKFDCDSMKKLIKSYFANIEGDNRNRFIIDLIRLASNEFV